MKFIHAQFIVVALFAVLLSSPAVASEKTWTQTNASGFGDSQNTSATLFKIWGQLYAVTDNVHGVQAYHYDTADRSWEEVTSWGFLDDSNNTAVSAKIKIRGNAVFLAFTNTLTGAQVWQLEDIGSQGHILKATQVNYDGFGNSGYTFVLHLLKFNNRILAYVQNSGDGNVRVLRTPVDSSQAYEDMSWEFMTDLDAAYAEGLDAAAVFKNTIYLANRIQAQIYTSTDGRSYKYQTTLDPSIATQINQFVVFQDMFFGLGMGGQPCDQWRHVVYYTKNGIDWKVDLSEPLKRTCYTQMVVKPHSNKAYILGFDAEDGVIYRRRGDIWERQMAVGLNGGTSSDDSNQKFSDGIWYQDTIMLATENQKDGTQIWTKQ